MVLKTDAAYEQYCCTPFRRRHAPRTPKAPQKESRSFKHAIQDPIPLMSPAEKQKRDQRRERTLRRRRQQIKLETEISPKVRLYADSVKPPETILTNLREFRKTYRTTSFKQDKLIKDPKILQVVDMSPDEVTARIADLTLQDQEDQGFKVPSRADGSQKFSFELDTCVLYRKEFTRVRPATENNGSYRITVQLLTTIFMLCMKRKSMKLRAIYYSNTQLYKSVRMVSEVVDDICCMIGCTRSSLRIFASEKCVVYGDITFNVGVHNYNGYAGGIEGIKIPSNTSSIRNMKSVDALFILVVEKDTVFERLAEDGFCEKYHCIMITAKGMPDVASRGFVNLSRSELKLPAYILVDFNPYGLRIYSVYRYGSKTMSYDSENLTTPNLKLLGIRYTDLHKYKISEKYKENMTEDDIMTAENLLELHYMKEHHADLKFMLDEGKKIQIEALYAHDLEYLAEVALPLMLEEKQTQLNDEYILKCEI